MKVWTKRAGVGLALLVASALLVPLASETPAAAAPAPTLTQTVVSTFAACALDSSGFAVCWGRNDTGMIGNGSAINSAVYPSPVLVAGGQTFASISAQSGTACAVTTTGQGYCWGSGGSGQLGNGTSSGTSTPSLVLGGHTWAKISVGVSNTCGVTTSGAGLCWGANGDGQLGDGSVNPSNTPVAITGVVFKSISPGNRFTCGVTTADAGLCWGYNFSGQLGTGNNNNTQTPAPVSGSRQWKAIEAGHAFACGVTTAGGGFCWGNNSSGQIGNSGAALNTAVNVPTALTGGRVWSNIKPGINGFVCGVTTAGGGFCWGYNTWGQLGNNDAGTNSNVPVSVNGTATWSTITTSTNASCGTTTAGVGRCWGLNSYSQLGNGGTTQSPIPVDVAYPPPPVSGSAADVVATEPTSGTSNATVTFTLAAPSIFPATIDYATSDGAASAMTLDYQATSGTLTIAAGATVGTLNVPISADAKFEGDETLTVNFSNPSWNLAPTVSSIRVTIRNATGSGPPAPTAAKISSGYAHACMVDSLQNGLCWGSNAQGQLGIGTTGGSATTPQLVGGGLKWKSISADGVNTCGVSTNDDGYCWGYNFYGAIGDGTKVDRNLPTPVDPGTPRKWKAVDAGRSGSCGVTTANAGLCWGNGDNGELGNGTWVDSLLPSPVSGGRSWAMIDARAGVTCGVITTGAGFCWGNDFDGKAGNGDPGQLNRNYPYPLAGSLVWQSVSISAKNGCGLIDNGDIYCWGGNEYGQLGDGTLTQRDGPTKIFGTKKWKAVTTGDRVVCAIDTADAGFCWGQNTYGVLGDGSTTSHITPSAMIGGLTWSSLSMGIHANDDAGITGCGLTTWNTPYCWGQNTVGQVGDASTTQRYQPTPVLYPPQVMVSVGYVSVNETAGNAVIPVTLSAPSIDDATISYETADYTAKAGEDYVATTGSFVIPRGSTAGSFSVPIINDNIFELREKFDVTVYGLSWNVPSANGTDIDITSDDAPALSSSLTGTSAGASCNGVTSNVATTGTALTMPSLRNGVPTVGIVNLNVTSNSYRGWVARMGAGPLTNGTHTIPALGASNGAPTAALPFTESVAMSSGSTTLSNAGNGPARFAGARFVGMSPTLQEVAGAPGPGTVSTCIVVRATVDQTTRAGGAYTTRLLHNVEGLF